MIPGSSRSSGGTYSSSIVPETDFGDIATITGKINEINRTAQQMANLARIPGAENLEAASSSMIADQLAGTVPDDVLALMGQSMAERGVGSGMINSPAARSAYMRALGLTSIGQQEAGQKNLSAAYARNPGAPLYDPSNLVVTPVQQAQLRLQEEQLALERQRLGRGYGGGGGGGGGSYTPTTAPTYGSTIVAPSYGTGYVSSGTPEEYTVSDAIRDQGGGYDLTGNAWGYQPTSSGTMYMGTQEGYNPDFSGYSDLLSQGGDTDWMDFLDEYLPYN